VDEDCLHLLEGDRGDVLDVLQPVTEFVLLPDDEFSQDLVVFLVLGRSQDLEVRAVDLELTGPAFAEEFGLLLEFDVGIER
jgi:hypothetical protein